MMRHAELIPHSYGWHCSIEEWEGQPKWAFVPSDGTGCWATDKHYDWDSNIFTDPKPSWATHVMWFNK